MTIKTVVLKNGAEEAQPVVTVAMMSLNRLIQDNPIAFYEMVQVCRDPNHQPFGNTALILKDLSLMEESGQVHDSLRNIVLSATEGDGLDLTLVSPIPSK